MFNIDQHHPMPTSGSLARPCLAPTHQTHPVSSGSPNASVESRSLIRYINAPIDLCHRTSLMVVDWITIVPSKDDHTRYQSRRRPCYSVRTHTQRSLPHIDRHVLSPPYARVHGKPARSFSTARARAMRCPVPTNTRPPSLRRRRNSASEPRLALHPSLEWPVRGLAA